MSESFLTSGRCAGIGALALCALTVLPSAASASVDYRVWFFDSVYETYEEGDITDGSSPLYVAPGWACGMRFENASYFRWVNEYGGTISSADAEDDITVWISKQGCPEGFAIVHGNQDLQPPEGASYLEITTSAGHDWIDEYGSWPDCGGCPIADEVTALPDHSHDIDVRLSAYATLTASLLNQRVQAGVADSIGGLSTGLAKVYTVLAEEVAARRRVPLGDREQAVRVLEDAMLKKLAASRRQLDSCRELARVWRFGEAFVTCTQGGQTLESSQSLLRTLQLTLETRR